MSELVSTDVVACENAATLPWRFFLSALPTERQPASRGRRRHAPLAATPHAVSFATAGVPAPLVAALAAAGITAPFPIQAATLPDALAGRDILGRGQTGSGKTLGFCIPLATRLADGYTSACRPRGLVLVPTRELASQVEGVLAPLAESVGLSVATIYGGVSQKPQVAKLRDRADIVVACPGRLADLIEQGHCHLGDVEISVLDEADHMADLGFLPVVRRLLDMTPPDGQRMLFSATLDAAVDVLARRFMNRPVHHDIGLAEAPVAIVHHLLTIAPTDRVGVVTALAGGSGRSLVFTRTKHAASRLARQLTASGIPAAELHGDLSQGARERNLATFAAGVLRVIVATDVAARGIHVEGIDLVIHADPPAEHKAYLHRSGRTARAGASGTAITLQAQAQAADVRDLMRKAGVVPLTATVTPGSTLLRSIAGEPVSPVTLPAARPAAIVAAPATGHGAAAMSAGFRGRRGR
jgi:superfamily II DNA/RNA helicase